MKKLYKLEKILTQGERRPTEEEQNVTSLRALGLRQTPQCWEVEKSLSYTRLTKVEKREETKVIRCLEMALYETYDSSDV